MSDFFKRLLDGEYNSFIGLAIGSRELLKTLVSADPQSVIIRDWLIEHARPEVAEIFLSFDSTIECSPWEVELFYLHYHLLVDSRLSEWEKVPNKKRNSHTNRVVRLARGLAEALEEENKPDYPPTLHFLDDECALGIIRTFKESIARNILKSTGYSYEYSSENKYTRDTASAKIIGMKNNVYSSYSKIR